MEDPHLVQLALERGFITQAQVDQAKREQALLSERGIERSLWFLIQDLGFVSDGQSRELRRYISSSRMRALEVEGYVIQGRLGSGGMGDVFRGVNAAKEEVAVKLLATKYSQHEEYAKRFQREAKATLRLMHPHITRSISAGVMEGQRYLIMELVQGKSLKERIVTGGPLSETDGKYLLVQMALALRHAWRRGVLHRDVKPANMILAPPRDGIQEPFCAKLCDFGLAKTWQVAGEETASLTRGELTHSGVALGTPHYMSPEQASGEHDLDQRTDIYGLGATLYHALLGQTLYTGKSSAAIMYKQVTEALDLSPLRQQGIAIPFLRVIEGMLTKERARRLRDWDAVLDLMRGEDAALVAGCEAASPSPRSSSEVGLDPIAISSSSATLAQPPPGPVAKATPTRGKTVLVGGGIMIALAALLIAAFVLVLGAPATVNPQTLAQRLLQYQPGAEPLRLVLEPGDYSGPFTFGVGHSKLTLAAAGPGVRFVTVGGGGTLVRLQTGLSNFHLDGIALVPGEATAIEALSGAQAGLSAIRVEGGCPTLVRVSGADLEITGLSGRSTGVAVVVENQGRLRLASSSISAPVTAVQNRQGHIEGDRLRIAAVGGGAGNLIDCEGGSLNLRAAILEGQGCDAALVTNLAQVELVDVALRGARVGWRADGAIVRKLERVTVEAVDTGMSWIGPRDPAWSWNGLLVRAPRAALGVNGDLTGSGADAGALAAIPLSATHSP